VFGSSSGYISLEAAGSRGFLAAARSDINMGDSQTFWLNVTNATLGIVVAVCLLAVTLAVVCDIVAGVLRRRRLQAE